MRFRCISAYQEVEKLLERISGEKLLSDQKIWEIVVNKAVEVSSKWQQEIQSIEQSIESEPSIASRVDIYNPLSKEILLFDELITYITKHETEIINYELRCQAGKTIGSGRRSKGVDTVIGHRQKHKGMSWRALGSRALAILKVVECNGQWRQIWLTQMAA